MNVVAAASEAQAEALGGDMGLAIGIAIALMVLAAGLFFLEIMIPSFGLISLVGIGCVAGALFIAFGLGGGVGLLFLGATVVVVPVAVLLAFKVLRKTPLVLTPEAEEARAQARTEAPNVPAIGSRGKALTRLRPAGTAVFDGRRVSVVTTGDMVDPGQDVEIIQVGGGRTVVRPVGS